MLLASPLMLAVAFVRFEARLPGSARRRPAGRAASAAQQRFRDRAGDGARASTCCRSFYLTFAVYLQSGLHQSPLAAGLATLPFAIGFFVSFAAVVVR